MNPPPFRAEQIGSLLRPAELLQARADSDAGKLSAAQLEPIEDAAIKSSVEKLRSLGIKSVTDGEFRRHMFFDGAHDNFDGFVKVDDPPIDIFMAYVPDVRGFVNSPAKKPAATYVCKGKIKRRGGESPYVKQFKYVASLLPAEEVKFAKITVAAPEWYHLRHSSKYAYSHDVYKSDDEYFGDIAIAFQEELQALYEAGCRSVQFDDPLLAYFADQGMLKGMKEAGIDPAAELGKYVKLYNDCLAKRPKDMRIGLHVSHICYLSAYVLAHGKSHPHSQLCRGNVSGPTSCLPFSLRD